MFITVEGIDGSGKSTFCQLLADKIRETTGRYVYTTAEPTNYYKDLIFKSSSPYEELLLFIADRERHINEDIYPALRNGAIVITDRFKLSTLAYQWRGNHRHLNLVMSLMKALSPIEDPTLNIILDVSVEEAKRRLALRKKKDDYDDASEHFMQNVRQAYLDLAQLKDYRSNTLVIDNTLDSYKVFKTAYPTIKQLLNL